MVARRDRPRPLYQAIFPEIRGVGFTFVGWRGYGRCRWLVVFPAEQKNRRVSYETEESWPFHS
ncbi:Uncharacterised protein [Mycobacteroides abscessus subsp. bolletii]|nr:Uncharacterised protein [Mycobacteroides abscessus subsp. abscessus]SHP43592.1 Uncharacterised protein [Mycobacteroides abscessus subsp. bolletii]SLE40068.1 Uncharacterised protein [Mycobacteroides abscessus subsp. massiliense]SPX75762.1 Uncharacterised protein [Mycobacteroides abscessus]SHR17869.1 Uncharacterised protein [Mycobacteroides abscessus subsp. bolletii]